MKKTYKNIIIVSTIITVISAVIFIACKKTTNEPETDDSMKKFEQLMQQGAAVHNEGLEYAYDELLKTQSVDDFHFVTEAATFGFIQSHPFFQSNVDDALISTERMFERLKTDKKTRESNRLWHDEDDALLSYSQKEWLIRINDAIDKADDIKQMLNDLDEIKNLAFKRGNLDDQYIVIIAVEIGKESMQYWYENGSKWQELNPEFLESKGWFSWGSVGKNDIAYGIAGAVVGAGLGALGGGAGAGPGALAGGIGGALTGSLGSALLQVMDRWGW